MAISALALYTYTIIYIFNHDMEEIFATFIMLVIYSLFFLLFLISVERLSLLVWVEFAYRNLQRYKEIKKSLSFFWIVLYLYKFWRYLGYDFTITLYLCFLTTLCLFIPWFIYLFLGHESCYGWFYVSFVKVKLRPRKDTFRPFFFW